MEERETSRSLGGGAEPASLSHAIFHVGGSGEARTIGTAIKLASDLYSVSDHLAMALFTNGRDSLNCTLEAVECMPVTGRNQLKGLVVFVTANFALCHNPSAVVPESTQPRTATQHKHRCRVTRRCRRGAANRYGRGQARACDLRDARFLPPFSEVHFKPFASQARHLFQGARLLK